MTTRFLWIAGPRGPTPTRCDYESIVMARKYWRVLAEHKLSDDLASLPLDALAQRFPAPEIGDYGHGDG